MFFQKLCCLWDNMEKLGIARQATGDSMIQCICFACWMTKATDTFRIYYTLLLHNNIVYSGLPECYIISTLPFLLLNKQGSCLPFAHCFLFLARWVFFLLLDEVCWSVPKSLPPVNSCLTPEGTSCHDCNCPVVCIAVCLQHVDLNVYYGWWVIFNPFKIL
jgi:hypothetical protein